VPVTLRLRGHELQGLAPPVAEDKQAVAAGLVVLLPQVSPPAQATLYNVEHFLALIEGPKLPPSQSETCHRAGFFTFPTSAFGLPP